MRLPLDDLRQVFHVIREDLLYRLAAFRLAESRDDERLMRQLADDLISLDAYHEGVTTELHARFGVPKPMASLLEPIPPKKRPEARKLFRLWQTLFRLKHGKL